MYATYFKAPTGAREVIDILGVDVDDADWLADNNVAVSLEQLAGKIVLYGDVGHRLDDVESEDPDEVIVVVSFDEDPQTAIRKLREMCEERLNTMPGRPIFEVVMPKPSPGQI